MQIFHQVLYKKLVKRKKFAATESVRVGGIPSIGVLEFPTTKTDLCSISIQDISQFLANLQFLLMEKSKACSYWQDLDRTIAKLPRAVLLSFHL